MRQELLLAGPGPLTIGLRIHSSIEWAPMPARMIIHKNLGGAPNGWHHD
ncbi:MAG: hypothetical protein OWU33_03335 [Firmicutes bacterium]|nr:hypothetical protein [Bacillota bacterium]